jgi:hypothetical protein
MNNTAVCERLSGAIADNPLLLPFVGPGGFSAEIQYFGFIKFFIDDFAVAAKCK